VSDDVIRFSAIVYKVQTLVDGGLRLTLDLPENAIEQVSQLIQCKRGGAVLEVTAVPIKPDDRTDESRKIHI
jgi:hypothetical protein